MRTKHADMKTVAVIKRARPPDGRDFGFYSQRTVTLAHSPTRVLRSGSRERRAMAPSTPGSSAAMKSLDEQVRPRRRRRARPRRRSPRARSILALVDVMFVSSAKTNVLTRLLVASSQWDRLAKLAGDTPPAAVPEPRADPERVLADVNAVQALHHRDPGLANVALVPAFPQTPAYAGAEPPTVEAIAYSALA